MCADTFAQQRDRQDGDQQRRGKEDRIDLCQRQMREGVKAPMPATTPQSVRSATQPGCAGLSVPLVGSRIRTIDTRGNDSSEEKNRICNEG